MYKVSTLNTATSCFSAEIVRFSNASSLNFILIDYRRRYINLFFYDFRLNLTLGIELNEIAIADVKVVILPE